MDFKVGDMVEWPGVYDNPVAKGIKNAKVIGVYSTNTDDGLEVSFTPNRVKPFTVGIGGGVWRTDAWAP